MTKPKTGDLTDTGNDASKKTSAPTATSPPSAGPTQPTYDRELVYASDGKTWREKYRGYTGRVQQLEEYLEKAKKEHTSALEELQEKLEKRDSEILELTTGLDQAGQQLKEFAGLKEQLPELEEAARQAAKLRAILEYPDLVTKQVIDTIVTEDGEEHELLTNPVIDLVTATDLEGDDLRMLLQRLSKMVESAETSDGDEPPATLVTDGSGPAPGAPVEETPEYWEAKAREAQRMSVSEPSESHKHLQDMLEYTKKAKEARSQLQS
jgi:hypothetical protein